MPGGGEVSQQAYSKTMAGKRQAKATGGMSSLAQVFGNIGRIQMAQRAAGAKGGTARAEKIIKETNKAQRGSRAVVKNKYGGKGGINVVGTQGGKMAMSAADRMMQTRLNALKANSTAKQVVKARKAFKRASKAA